MLRYLWALPNTLIGALLVPFVLLTGGRARLVTGVLEVSGPLVALLLRHCTFLPGGVAAMTLGHVVLGRDECALDLTRRHERVHVAQCERWGPGFIPAYLAASAWSVLRGTGGYFGNYFERDAESRSRTE